MKKKLFIAVLLISILLVCTLTACAKTCKDGHTWQDGQILKNPTCTEVGEMVQKCSVCNVTKNVPINSIGHAFGDWTDNGDGTHSRVCSNDNTHIETADHVDANADNNCDACGSVLVAPECQHVWGAWIDNEDGTCSRVCGLDNSHVETTEHNYEEVSRTPATCTEAEVITRVCSQCGNSSIIDGAPATDHDYPAEWTNNGDDHSKVCANGCGDDLIEAHSHQETSRTPATCDNAGTVTYTCVCGDTYTNEGEPATGHETFVGYEVINGILYWSDYCKHTIDGNPDDYCSYNVMASNTSPRQALASSQTYSASNERDLRTLLENGFGAKLTEDIVLEDGTISVSANNVTLNLNGHSITSSVATPIDDSRMACTVIAVAGNETKLTIVGEGSINATSAEAEFNSTITAADYGYVVIDGNATLHSVGYTNVVALINGRVDIWNGTYITDATDDNGARRTLFAVTDGFTFADMDFDALDTIMTRINVYGGSFVAFDPSNHQGNGTYTSKIVECYSHTIYNAESDTYTMAFHDFLSNDDDLTEETAVCSVCGFHMLLVKEDTSDLDFFVVLDGTGRVAGTGLIIDIERDAENDGAVYLKDRFTGLYLTVDSEGYETFVADKADAVAWIITGDPATNSLNIAQYGNPDLESVIEGVFSWFYCDNHVVESVVTPATCDEGGYTTNSCANCGRTTITDVVDALGHAYGDWESNGDDTHQRVCANDPSHIETGDCSGGEATCSTRAVCDHCGTEYGDLLDHTPAEERCGYTYKVEDDLKVVYAQYDCTSCDAIVEVEVKGFVPVANEEELRYILTEVGHNVVFEADIEISSTIYFDQSMDNGGDDLLCIELGEYQFMGDGVGELLNITATEGLDVEIYAEGDKSIYSNEYPIAVLSGYASLILDDCHCTVSSTTSMFDLSGNASLYTFNDGYYRNYCEGYDFKYFNVSGDAKVYLSAGIFTGYNPEEYLLDEKRFHVVSWDYDNEVDQPTYAIFKHVFTTTTVEPTCTSAGYTLKSCSCGFSYETNPTEINANAHSYVYTDKGDGTHSAVCEHDESHVLEAEAHVDEDTNGACDKCGAEVPIPEIKATYSFVDNFGTYASSWGNSYSSKTISSTALGTDLPAATFTLSNASKQGSTITDRPTLASKGTVQYVTVEVADMNITAVTFNLQQWTTKTFNDIHIEYFDGTNWVSCSSKITTPASLSSTTIPDGVTKVRLSYYSSGTSSNKQLGLSDIELTLK